MGERRLTDMARTLLALRVVLGFKAAGTVLLLCLPMLTLSTDAFAEAFGIRVLPELALHLLGASYLALTLAYLHACVEASRGHVPAAVLAVGIVSNFRVLG